MFPLASASVPAPLIVPASDEPLPDSVSVFPAPIVMVVADASVSAPEIQAVPSTATVAPLRIPRSEPKCAPASNVSDPPDRISVPRPAVAPVNVLDPVKVSMSFNATVRVVPAPAENVPEKLRVSEIVVAVLPDTIQFATPSEAPVLKLWLPPVKATVAPEPSSLPAKLDVPFNVSVSPEAIVSVVAAAAKYVPPNVRFSWSVAASFPVSDQRAVAKEAPLSIAWLPPERSAHPCPRPYPILSMYLSRSAYRRIQSSASFLHRSRMSRHSSGSC